MSFKIRHLYIVFFLNTLVLFVFNNAIAQVNLQKGENWLVGLTIDRLSFSEDGRIYIIYDNHRSIGYYDLIDGKIELTETFNAAGLTYFIDFVTLESALYVASNQGKIGIFDKNELTIYLEAQKAGIDSITSIAPDGGSFYRPGYDGNFIPDLSVGTPVGPIYFSTKNDDHFQLTSNSSSYNYDGPAFVYDGDVSKALSDYSLICNGTLVITILWATRFGTTTYSDSLISNDLEITRKKNLQTSFLSLFIGTNQGLFWKSWDCGENYSGHFLKELQINDVQRFSPLAPLEDYYEQQDYTLAGTSNGLYYGGDTNGPSDSLYTLLPGTSGYQINDMTINPCAGEVYAASNNGIIQIKSLENKSFIPYIGNRISPSGEVLFCNGDTLKINSGLNETFDIQWFKNNDSIPGETSVSYGATETGVYRYALYNCFFEDLQYSNESKIVLDQEVEYYWPNPDSIIGCYSSDTLFVLTDDSRNTVTWFKNNVEIASDTLQLIITESGEYHAVITNCNDFSRTSVSTLVSGYILPPDIHFEPEVTCIGDTAHIVFSNHENNKIEWYYNDNKIDSLTNKTSIKTFVEGAYHVRASNPYCEAYSDALSLEKREPPTYQLIGNTYFCKGSDAILSFDTDLENKIYVNDELSSRSIVIFEETDLRIKIEDAYGCSTFDNIQITSRNLPEIQLTGDTTFCFGELVPLALILGSGFQEYYVNGLKSESEILISEAGEYEVQVVDYSSCINTQKIIITDKCPQIWIPNVFTPNSDGVNDYFEIRNLIPNCRLNIYTRNGALIYRSDNYANDWDGSNYPSGTYYYFLENRFYNKNFQGLIQILK